MRRSNRDQGAAVQVVGRADTTKSDARDVREAVAQLASNNAAESDTESGGGQVNLRGLGAGTTLVLLNGRRILGTGLTNEGQSYYSLAGIPTALIERVEVLRGGASAIYGSDAIAGVVNYITRRKFDGLTLQASGNLGTQSGGPRDGEVSAIWGKTTDRGSVIAMVSYYERSALMALDRPYSQGDPDKPAFPFKERVVPASGIPSSYARPLTLSNMGNPSAFLFTLPNAMANDLDPTPETVPAFISELRPDPACLAAPGGTYLQEEAYVEFVKGEELTGRFGKRCGFSYAPYYSYINPERRIHAYASLEQDFTPHLKAFGEFGYVQLSAEGLASPSFALTREVFVPADHPDIPAEWRDDARATSAPIHLIGRTRGAAYRHDSAKQSFRNDNFRIVAGLRGDLGGVAEKTWAENWSWEIAATHQQQYSTENAIDDITENLQRALNACTETTTGDDGMGPVTVTNPDFGRIPCFHPFYAEQSLNDTDAMNARGVTATEYIVGTSRPTMTGSVSVADAVLRGSFARLPGGEVGFAVGAQARRDRVDFRADRDNQIESFGFLLGTASWKGARNVYAGYAEIGLPVVRELELEAAARYEHYQKVGGSANPRLSARVIPFAQSKRQALQKLALRGSFTTSFRGPSLLQLRGRRVITTNFAGIFRPQRTEGNPNLTSEKSLAFDGGLNWKFAGLALDAEYWHYRYKDIVTIENAQAIWNRCQIAIAADAQNDVDPQTVAMTNPACFTQSGRPGIELDSTGGLNSATAEFINASSTKVHGIDFGVSYHFGQADAIGTFSISANASYLLSYKGRADRSQRCDPANRTGPGCEREFAGSRNALTFAPSLPKLRMNLPVSWSWHGHSLQATGNLLGSYTNDETSPEQPIPAWFTLNLQYSYRLDQALGKATTFTLGAINVMNADPPYVHTLLGYDGSQHDARGRMLYARLAQEF